MSKDQNKKRRNNKIYQYMISIDEFSDRGIEMLMPFLSEERKERAKKFYRLEDTKRSVLGYLLIHYALYKNYGIEMPCIW